MNNKKIREDTIPNVVLWLGAALLLAGLGLVSIADYYPFVWRDKTSVYAPKEIVVGSVFIAILFTSALKYCLQKRMNTSYNWLCTIEIYLLVSFPSTIFFTHAALIANGILDFSEQRTYNTVVLRKFTREPRRKRYEKLRYADIRDWRISSDTVRLELERQEYDAIEIDSSVRVVIKSGFLGYEWIVSRSLGMTARAAVPRRDKITH